jgi:hypothetical protein
MPLPPSLCSAGRGAHVAVVRTSRHGPARRAGRAGQARHGFAGPGIRAETRALAVFSVRHIYSMQPPGILHTRAASGGRPTLGRHAWDVAPHRHGASSRKGQRGTKTCRPPRNSVPRRVESSQRRLRGAGRPGSRVGAGGAGAARSRRPAAPIRGAARGSHQRRASVQQLEGQGGLCGRIKEAARPVVARQELVPCLSRRRSAAASSCARPATWRLWRRERSCCTSGHRLSAPAAADGEEGAARVAAGGRRRGGSGGVPVRRAALPGLPVAARECSSLLPLRSSGRCNN